MINFKAGRPGGGQRTLLTLSFSGRDLLKNLILNAAAPVRSNSSYQLSAAVDQKNFDFTLQHVCKIITNACEWQLRQCANYRRHKWMSYLNALAQFGPMPRESTHWTMATFYLGVITAYQVTQNKDYLHAVRQMAEENHWSLGPRLRHADDHCIGQTYLELYFLENDPGMIMPVRKTFEHIMAKPVSDREDWRWCDALFMAPPVLAQLSRATGEQKYLDFMNRTWWEAVELLYDPNENLFFRDQRFKIGEDGLGQREKNGQKIFWSRGNGWVMAALVRILKYMPNNYPDRARYIHLLQAMAERIIGLQGPDGLWRTSLLAPEIYPAPETSGSAFFCYALAWGINQGILDSETYLPVVQNAWQGLASAVQLSGRVGWVQQVGSKPQTVSRYDTEAYGVGAFLLAGSEVAALIRSMEPALN